MSYVENGKLDVRSLPVSCAVDSNFGDLKHFEQQAVPEILRDLSVRLNLGSHKASAARISGVFGIPSFCFTLCPFLIWIV